MITSVRIENFRGVREGGVDGLAPISVLVGPNNSGKSTALEAIAVGELAPRAHDIARLLLRRGGSPLDALGRVVARGASHALITAGSDGAEQARRANLSVGDNAYRAADARNEGLRDPMETVTVNGMAVVVDANGRCSGIYGDPGPKHAVRFVDVEAVRAVGALEDAYSTIDAAGQLPSVVKALARAMPGLTDLRILKVGAEFLLHAFFASGPPVPTYLAGDGFKRFLEVAAAVVHLDKGVVLLEEPESFQHPRYLQELATLLHLAARAGTQIILSTHSLELIDLLLLAPEAEGLAYPTVHRMRLVDGTLRATTLERESAARARDELLEDLRS